MPNIKVSIYSFNAPLAGALANAIKSKAPNVDVFVVDEDEQAAENSGVAAHS